MDMWRLEATLVDVVEGEGLSRVGAVFVHLYNSSSSSLRLLLLSSGCHDFGKCESHGNTRTITFSLSRALVCGAQLKDFHFRWAQMLLCKSLGRSRTIFSGWPTVQLRCWNSVPACFPSITIHQWPQYTWGKKGMRYKIKGDVSGDSGILSKPTIRRAVDGGMSHSTVC